MDVENSPISLQANSASLVYKWNKCWRELVRSVTCNSMLVPGGGRERKKGRRRWASKPGPSRASVEKNFEVEKSWVSTFPTVGEFRR